MADEGVGMRICYRAKEVVEKDGYYAIMTDGVEIRITFLTNEILRIRAGFDGGFEEDSYSLVMTSCSSITDDLLKRERVFVPVAHADFVDEEKEAILFGEKLKVVIHKHPFYLSIYDQDGTLMQEDIVDLGYREDSNMRRMHTSRIEEDDHFYGFGEKSGEIDKFEELMTMSCGDAMGYNARKTDSLYKHIPFYIKLQGSTGKAIGYFYHNTYPCMFNMGREKRNYWHRYSTYQTDGGDIDLFLIAGPKICDVIQRYTDLTGKSTLLPRGAYGYLGSSMYYPELPHDGDDAIIEFLDTAKEEGFPMDGFQLSSGYCAIETEEGIKRCTFTWNNKRFKDPKRWFDRMKERGVIVSANVKPGFLLVHPLLDEMKKMNMFVKACPSLPEDSDGNHEGLAVGTWWGGKGVFVDFTNPDARKQWKQYLKDNLMQYGCTSIWNDNCEYDSIIDQDCCVCHEGRGSTIGALRPVMANLMCMLSNEATNEYYPGRRPFTVCRSGHAGIQRYAQVWAGDNLTSWETLKYNIATILGMGMSGVANNGCDIGGFYGDAPEEELFIRWVQNGIFQPRFSIHSSNADNTVTEPWMYHDTASIIKEAIDFRYALIPYLYSLAYRASEKGLPIMTAECMVFQDDPKTYKEGIDFMWGDCILVANIVEKGQEIRHVYLPKGENDNECWYDFYSRKPYAPGSDIDMKVDIRSIPMFVKSGAIIPMAMNRMTNLTMQQATELKVLMAPDIDSSFVLYEDDGISNDYCHGTYLKTHITIEAGEKTKIHFQCEGSYTTHVETFLLDIIHREKSPFYVLVDGHEMHHYLHRKKFDTCTEGWYYSQTLRSVLVKYNNPKRSHDVLVSFEQLDLIGM